MLRRLPMFKVLAVAQVALLARRHLSALNREERRRLVDLVRRPHRLNSAERNELRRLALKLEPRAFTAAAADQFSPIPFTGRILGGRRRR